MARPRPSGVRCTLRGVIGAAKPSAAGVSIGMRRVSWVRITVTDEGVTCEVAGVGHRLPMERRVSLETALALAADGVPTVIRSDGHLSHRLPAAS